MTTLFFTSSSCAENACNGLVNPLHSLSNQIFAGAGFPSSINILKEQKYLENVSKIPFREQKEIACEQKEACGSQSNWEHFSHVWHEENIYQEDFLTDTEVEEYRQEWSDEYFTKIYVEKHGLEQSPQATVFSNGSKKVRRNSYLGEFQEIDIMNESFQSFHQSSFIKEYSASKAQYHMKKPIASPIFQTPHCDLFQACFYLLDDLLITLESRSTETTRRPCPEAEWDWGRLFSESRWYNREKERDQSNQQKLAQKRLKMLMGHLTRREKRTVEKEWEWEFFGLSKQY
ncbi:hypothetical protein G9A89_007224 [Geosiphon pyriformis]|nr:hypothetical protein G9A89_007224 [Geosiphon pyriformis]